jgi:hypothetical protein
MSSDETPTTPLDLRRTATPDREQSFVSEARTEPNPTLAAP